MSQTPEQDVVQPSEPATSIQLLTPPKPLGTLSIMGRREPVRISQLLRTRRSRVAAGLVLVLFAGGITAVAIANKGKEPATHLAVGACFDAPANMVSFESVHDVPCDQPHDSQVFAEPKIAESSFPEVSNLSTEASSACNASSAETDISQAAPQNMAIMDFYPQNASTFQSENYFICAIQFPGETLSMSFVNSPVSGN